MKKGLYKNIIITNLPNDDDYSIGDPSSLLIFISKFELHLSHCVVR